MKDDRCVRVGEVIYLQVIVYAISLPLFIVSMFVSLFSIKSYLGVVSYS